MPPIKFKTLILILCLLIVAITVTYFVFDKYYVNRRDNTNNILNDSYVEVQPSSTDISAEQGIPTEGSAFAEDLRNDFLAAKPASIRSIRVGPDRKVILSIMWARDNPKWQPGVDETGDFFLYPDKKLYDISFLGGVEYYACGAGIDGNDTSPDVPTDAMEFITKASKWLLESDYYPTYYFVMDSSNIRRIFEQCLP